MTNYALSLSLTTWKEWVKSQNAPAYVADQIYSWIFSKGCLDPQKFSNLPKEIRDSLQASFTWDLPEIDAHLISKDGSEKFLLKTKDGFVFEMVFMFYDDRSTL
ncbi:MAG: hypothetical protein FJZ56_01650, partial [Chlamydiae bacterium]|nr:hypothetical protein [Chlamydiota bacterium]